MSPVTGRQSSDIVRSLPSLGLFVGLFATLVEQAAASAPAPRTSTAKFEVRFMENMIDHHEMAVQMGQVCLKEDLVHPELQDLCQNIVTSQSQQQQEMESWLAQWYGVSNRPQMTPGAMNQVERLAALSGSEVEITFLQEMTKHHEKAVKEGQICMERAYHQELISLCQNIVSSQSAEIQQMQTWLCDWSGICKQE